MWHRVLVGYDFSACAARALEVALGLAARHGSTVTLVHASALPPNLSAGALVTPPGATQAVRIDDLTAHGARGDLELVATQLHGRGCKVDTLAVAAEAGDVSAEILRAADAIDADVIVLGTHGRTGFAHLLLGSVAEKVIRGAKVPVVTVRSSAPEPPLTREEAIAEDELSG